MLFYMYLTYLFRVKHSDSGDILLPIMPLKYLIVKRNHRFTPKLKFYARKLQKHFRQ